MNTDTSGASTLVECMEDPNPPPTATQTAADPAEPAKRPTVDADFLRKRVHRLRQSVFAATLYSIPVLFLLMGTIVGLANWRPDANLLGHVFGTAVSATGGAVLVGGFLWLALSNATRVYAARLESLLRDGILVPIEEVTCSVFCVAHLKMVLGRGLAELWQTAAHRLCLRLPTMHVGCHFELNGKPGMAGEIFFGDEVPFLDEHGQAWALVHPKNRYKHCILRQHGDFAVQPVDPQSAKR